MSRGATLAGLAQLVSLLDADETLPLDERRRRDRQLGRTNPHVDDTGLLLAWLAARRGDDDPPGMLPLVVPALLFAALAGWGTATAVFFFDGGARVNVVSVLAVFVLLQALLLAAFALATLPGGLRHRVPGLCTLGSIATAVSPARLLAPLSRWLPSSASARLRPLLGDAGRRHAQLASPARWLLLSLSQDMALVFNLAALASAAALVVFTDLAFGWATTLDAGDAGFHALLQTLATPWAALLPAAVPDFELVTASRYFRLDDAPADAATLTRWWPFVLACMLVYGVLPRVLTAAFAHWRLARATRRALLGLPASRALLVRMRGALVETAGEDEDGDEDPAVSGSAASDRGEEVALDAPVHVVDWAGLPLEPARLARLLGDRFGFETAVVHPAGGSRTLAEDEATVRAAAGAGSVLVACKAWEPPLLELQDFLQALREALGGHVLIAVAPLEIAADTLVAPSAQHMAQWRDAVRGGGDAHRMLLRTHPSSNGPAA